MRKQHRSLRDGAFNVLLAQNGGLVCLRQWQAEQTLVAINHFPGR